MSTWEIIKERFEHEVEFDGVLFTTQYSNGPYIIYVNESGNDTYVNVVRTDDAYPTISNGGINISATGSLKIEELERHIERLHFAKRTYEQIFEMFQDVRIK